MMHCDVVLSYVQARIILQAIRCRQSHVNVSLDLGLTTQDVRLDPDAVELAPGIALSAQEIEQIESAQPACFTIGAAGPRKIQTFSERYQRFYSLMATELSPTVLNSGFPMHRFKGIDPFRASALSLETIRPMRGSVLDTCTGLGYTAIHASRTADRVITVELDLAMIEIARQNPWSRELFSSPRIEQHTGDVRDVIMQFQPASFDRIVHDPPTISLAGELYAARFYLELFRVLRPGGRLFHYIGDLRSKLGARVARGAEKRLCDTGFTRVTRRPDAFGLVAVKRPS